MFVIYVIMQNTEKNLFQLCENKATQYYELIHFDIWDPSSIPSTHGHKYFIIALDDYSRFT